MLYTHTKKIMFGVSAWHLILNDNHRLEPKMSNRVFEI